MPVSGHMGCTSSAACLLQPNGRKRENTSGGSPCACLNLLEFHPKALARARDGVGAQEGAQGSPLDYNSAGGYGTGHLMKEKYERQPEVHMFFFKMESLF